MTKIHTIKDESLGGILREYVEVERKAGVGDYAIHVGVNTVYKINRLPKKMNDDCLTIIKCDDLDLVGETAYTHTLRNFYALEPTDIVHIDGARYRLVDRKAEVGEKVIYYYEGNSEGIPRVVNEVDDEVVRFDFYVDDEGDEVTGYAHDAYRVLVPVSTTDDNPTVDTRHASPEVVDLLANLARRVTSLERKLGSVESQLRDTQGNVEKLAEEFESYRGDYLACGSGIEHLSERVEMVIDDIAMLDERTQVVNAINKHYESGARS